MIYPQLGHEILNVAGRDRVGMGTSGPGETEEWFGGVCWRLRVILEAAFRRTLLMDNWGQGNSCLGQKGPRRSFEGRLEELEIFPPMAQRALCRPLAAPPLMAIFALIMAMYVVMP